MIHLVSQHGTGDAYMTLAFAKAVERTRHQEVRVLVHTKHDAIRGLFPGVNSSTFEGNVDSYLRAYHRDDFHIYVHPATPAINLDISRFALLGRPVTHADLWRSLLGLPLNEPMERGIANDATLNRGSFSDVDHSRTVLLIPEARSWPNRYLGFWDALEAALAADGWRVSRNRPEWSLGQLLIECFTREWVIGPQCGVMAILCHAMFPCRKTIATPAIEGTGWIVPTTFPYASVSTFAGEDYADVEEVKITSDTALAIRDVMAGANAARLSHGGFVSGVAVKLTYGDFFDRLSILEIKAEKLTGNKRAAIYREYLQYLDLAAPIMTPSTRDLYLDLRRVNLAAWEHNELSVTGMYQDGIELSEHFAKAARFNRQRVDLKNKINEVCGSAHTEIKSYYGGTP